MILHIPHASTKIPDHIRSQIQLNDSLLNDELLVMTDWYTDELFCLPEFAHKTIIFPYSRLVVDPERFIDNSAEPMAPKGMGVVYDRTSNGNILRAQPSESEKSALLNKYYWPHHLHLSKLVQDEISRLGKCLIIDCHSFSSVPLLFEFDQNSSRPDVCIGIDSFHSPDKLIKLIESHFSEKGYSVALNRPYSGSIVPSEYFRKSRHVKSIMIELNRRLYMDESSGLKKIGFDKVQHDVRLLIAKLENV